ncbi:3-phosphoshikimate 1-carboxyvinyltransferase [Alkalihalobacillus xiaoxiensis]|uniref:3-phosphoshikimate 1-carboxyvinyltransferase n=1 Tax=Shouchella xiaoxiensis TaxID=766895 RepID=A0ABS2SXA3_9BACI|nr:3-phosphoshikimate 1-carboxyvinyltransferase [Shouchella xiaoxiensis]MBM7840169.1 3-phosphoshikimate 1-carboxyvinyltransferase [Shouchella xiaoxiensis]
MAEYLKLLSAVNSPLSGELVVPGDKSISHRAVMFGAMAKGTTTITGFLAGEDCLSTIACFRKMGVIIEQHETSVSVEGKGIDGLLEPEAVLDVGNSGTTTRLMLGILAGRPFHSVVVGDESIATRPMKRVVDPLQQMGAVIDGRDGGDKTPLSIRGGALDAITYQMPVASAQVKSALMLAGLQARGTTTIKEVQQTRDHTEQMLEQFGVKIEREKLEISIEGGQTLKATNVIVPADISSAAFFLVGACMVEGSQISLQRVGLNPTRAGIINVLKRSGAAIEIEEDLTATGEPYGTIRIKATELKPFVIEGDDIPTLIDEIPVLAVLATQINGTSMIRDAEELKVKETNRIDTVVSELKQLGADIEATEDGMIIRGGTPLTGGVVDSHGDHRIGMAMAIAALVAKGNVSLKNSEAIQVSYPSFFSDLTRLIER